jgi:hypothetical protein
MSMADMVVAPRVQCKDRPFLSFPQASIGSQFVA